MKRQSIFLLLSLVLFTGWGKKQLGEAIPSNIPVTKLQDIQKNPQAYKDKDVVLEGNYGFYCCPTDFSYKEGVETVEVSPIGFDTPKEKTGRPVRIYAVVRVGEKHEKAEKEEGKSHGEFSIEAKGVDFK